MMHFFLLTRPHHTAPHRCHAMQRALHVVPHARRTRCTPPCLLVGTPALYKFDSCRPDAYDQALLTRVPAVCRRWRALCHDGLPAPGPELDLSPWAVTDSADLDRHVRCANPVGVFPPTLEVAAGRGIPDLCPLSRWWLVGWLVGLYTFGSGAVRVGSPPPPLRAALLDAPRAWGGYRTGSLNSAQAASRLVGPGPLGAFGHLHRRRCNRIIL